MGQKSGYFSSGGAACDDFCQEFALGEVADCKASGDLEGDCFVGVNLCVLLAGFGCKGLGHGSIEFEMIDRLAACLFQVRGPKLIFGGRSVDFPAKREDTATNASR